jgi:hypothetical protein
MIRYKIILLLSIIIIFFSCDEIDNYEMPNGAIFGKLIDNITGEGLQTEQPNGFTIRLFEKGGNMNTPISFYGKPDGTFRNALIFQNDYKVIPCEGAFFPIDTVTVEVKSETECNFEVVPFLAVRNVSVTSSAGKIITNYKIERSKVGDKIVVRKTLVSNVSTVDNSIYNYMNETDISEIPDEEILSTNYSDVVEGLNSGNYYVRIAVRTNNSLRKYNYSKIFPVTVP